MSAQREPSWVLPRRTVLYVELGKLVERVLRDMRLEAKTKLLIQAIGYFHNLKGGPVSWSDIESYTGASRAELYWGEAANTKMKRPSPLHQAIQSGYVEWKKGSGPQGQAEFFVTSADATHQRADAPHQREDAPHQRGDAPHQRADAPHQREILPDTNRAPKPEQTQPPPIHGQSVTNLPESPRVQSVYKEILRDPGEIGDLYDVQKRPSVDKPGDKSPRKGAKIGGITTTQLTTMRLIFEESGLPSHVIHDCIEHALRAVVEHGVQPSRIVAIQKVLTLNFGNSQHDWPQRWRTLIDHAARPRPKPSQGGRSSQWEEKSGHRPESPKRASGCAGWQ